MPDEAIHHLKDKLLKATFSNPTTPAPSFKTSAPPNPLTPSTGNLSSSNYQPLARPRDDAPRAGCGNEGKSKLLPTHRAFPLFGHRLNTHRAERTFVPTLITIQTLAQRRGIEPVALHTFAPLIQILGLYNVVLDAEFLEPPVQVKTERTRLITGHHVTGELRLFNHKEHEFLIGHLLHGLRSRPVNLTACPTILGVGVNAKFDELVGDGWLARIDRCHGLQDRGTSRRSRTSCHLQISKPLGSSSTANHRIRLRPMRSCHQSPVPRKRKMRKQFKKLLKPSSRWTSGSATHRCCCSQTS